MSMIGAAGIENDPALHRPVVVAPGIAPRRRPAWNCPAKTAHAHRRVVRKAKSID